MASYHCPTSWMGGGGVGRESYVMGHEKVIAGRPTHVQTY